MLNQPPHDCCETGLPEHKLEKHIGEGPELEQSMVRKIFSARGCDNGQSNAPRSPSGVWLSGVGQVLSAEATFTIIGNSKREVDFEKAFFPTLLEHSADADSTEPS